LQGIHRRLLPMNSSLRWSLVSLTLFLGAGIGLWSCAAVEKTAADILISDEQEEELGAQVKQQLEQKEGLKYFNDPVVEQYVKDLFAKIRPLADKDRDNVNWRVFVVDDAKTVNAFATPGGYVYVITGLLLTATDEAEVLSVLAHESGHVVGRHSARQMVEVYGLETVLSVALGKDPSILSEMAAKIGANGALLANSRAHETEADEYGATYTSGASYDPRGLIRFFQKLQGDDGNTPQVMKWLSTHPATEDRIAHIEEYIGENNLGGTQTGGATLGTIQERIRTRSGIVGADGGSP
jgi:predicted Zn-dependent protease